nr:PKD domain-containing protein [Bacteroidota bacterium]
MAEYFFDDDPGYGFGTPVYGAGDDETMISFNAPVGGLTDGLHTLFIRSKTLNGSWSQTMARPFLKQILPEDANPGITYLEYFFDTDPGFGLATPIEVDAFSPIEIAVNLPLELLDYGLHNLYVRSQDANGRWSIVLQRAFIMGNYPADPLPELVKAEYFIDEDPGQGLAEPVMFNPNNGIHEQEFDANLDGLEWGEHTIYMRAMDESGSWSITVAEPFNVEEPPIIAEFSADITAGSVPLSVQFTDETYISEPNEWFWNFGDGVTSTEQNPVHMYADPGTYTVSLTATGPEGTDMEVKEDYITVYPPLYSLEYFFDEDPGYGNGSGVYTYSSNLGGFDFLIPLEELDDGYHLLFVRINDTSGVWTQTMSRSFLKTRLLSDPDPTIVQLEYFVDDDPGYGLGESLAVSTSATPVVEALISLDGYDDGLHNIFVRSQDENGRWSETFTR